MVVTAKSSGYVKHWAKNSIPSISFNLDHNVMGEITSSPHFTDEEIMFREVK